MNKTNKRRSNNRYKSRNEGKGEKKPVSEQTYRFRRVLGDILKFLNTIPDKSSYLKAQNDFGEQLTELIQKGYTWGFGYPIPVHEADFGALQKKEWAAIRAIVRKQEYTGANPDH